MYLHQDLTYLLIGQAETELENKKLDKCITGDADSVKDTQKVYYLHNRSIWVTGGGLGEIGTIGRINTDIRLVDWRNNFVFRDLGRVPSITASARRKISKGVKSSEHELTNIILIV